MCLFLLLLLLSPRLALGFVWLFTDRVDDAFGSFVWPLLGLLFLPWTTLAYVLTWGPIDGVSGFGWFWVALGLLADLATYSARAARQRLAA